MNSVLLDTPNNLYDINLNLPEKNQANMRIMIEGRY